MGEVVNNNFAIHPGVLEVFCGPMKSGKSREVLNRVDKLRFMENAGFVFFKPKIDKREKGIKSRFGDLSCECVFIDESNPSEIFRYLLPKYKMVVIEEAQFFDLSIVSVVQELLGRGLNVIVSGLDLDFRGEPFGAMKSLLCIADRVVKLTGVCEYLGCNQPANRTQKLIEGKPAHYNSSIVSIEGSNEKEEYQCRCLKHHFVPGKIL